MTNLEKVKLNPMNLEFIPKEEQTFEVCEYAILADKKAFKFVGIDMGKYNEHILKYNPRHIYAMNDIPLQLFIHHHICIMRYNIYYKSASGKYVDEIHEILKECLNGTYDLYNKLKLEDREEAIAKLQECYDNELEKIKNREEWEAKIERRRCKTDKYEILAIIAFSLILLLLFIWLCP